MITDESDIFVASDVGSILYIQQEMNRHMMTKGWLNKYKSKIYWNMLQTVESVAKCYDIARERMDKYGV